MRLIKIYYVFVIVSIFCTSENEHKKTFAKNLSWKHHQKDTTVATQYPELLKETNIQTLITGIELSDRVYIGGIGITGEESREYDCYKRLCEICPDSVFVRLSFNKSAVVRLYAYYALLKKNKTLALRVQERLLNDKKLVSCQSGCIIMKMPISSFVQFQVLTASR